MGIRRGSEGPASPGVRPVFWVLLGVAVVVAAAAVVVRQRQVRAHEVGQAAAGRAERVRLVSAIAFAPLPSSSPLVERPGKDAFGYPRSYVDLAGLRSLLAHRRFDELTRYAEDYQRQFEGDFHYEYYARAVAYAFGSTESDLGPLLDAWVEASPKSFAPYLGRGYYRFQRGVAARGTNFAKETDATNFAAMREQFAHATADLERALGFAPRLVPALGILIDISSMAGTRADTATQAQRAFSACAACMQPRVLQQDALEPRWGGSYREMQAAADAAPVSDNPMLRLLPGYAELDRAEDFVRDHQLERALEHVERACALGDSLDFWLEKADIQRRLSNLAGALQTLRSAQDRLPSSARVSFGLAEVEADAKDWAAAYRDLVAGLRIDPTSSSARHLMPYVVGGLISVAWQAHQQGRDGEAIDLLDQAAELGVTPEIDARRNAVLTAGFHGSDAEINALDTAALAAPHDFAAHAKLDYALATKEAWPRIEAMWTRYIAANPTDARAYRERAGTFARQHRMPEAHADAERACDLGSSAGCSLARR